MWVSPFDDRANTSAPYRFSGPCSITRPVIHLILQTAFQERFFFPSSSSGHFIDRAREVSPCNCVDGKNRTDDSKYSPLYICRAFFPQLHKKIRWTLSDSRDASNGRWSANDGRRIHGSVNDRGLCAIRERVHAIIPKFGYAIRLPLPLTRREREIPLFTSVISYNGSHAPRLTFFPSLRGLIRIYLEGWFSHQ